MYDLLRAPSIINGFAKNGCTMSVKVNDMFDEKYSRKNNCIINVIKVIISTKSVNTHDSLDCNYLVLTSIELVFSQESAGGDRIFVADIHKIWSARPLNNYERVVVIILSPTIS